MLGERKRLIPPYAGITLTRFFGYNLSPAMQNTPGNTENLNFMKLSNESLRSGAKLLKK
jgi:hypothetical protein